LSTRATKEVKVNASPNIVFILVDNIGWGSFGAYGGTIPTPRIDRLANEGIRFNNYNVEAQCTPTRSAGWRHGNTRSPNSFPTPATPPRCTASGTWATSRGYTAWPLFKESGIPVPMIWEGKKGQDSTPVMPLDLNVRPIVDGNYIIPKTVEYIKRNAAAKKPFFVYVGYSEMHQPVIGNPDFVGKSTQRGGLFADVIGEMDYRVGQILDAVKEAGVDENTIVILSSDNAGGGAIPQIGGALNGPWRGNFTNTPFEGSMRVPAMIRWPGTVPAGVVTNEMLASVDWLPTLAAMVGASNLVPKDRPIDGVDASAFMLGRSNATGRDSYMFFGVDGELMSIKWRTYKTIFRYTEDTVHPAIQSGLITPQFPMFYDLSSDPHEDNNLFYSDLTNGWMLAPNFKLIGEYERSLREYPNIEVGEDFKGYQK
jgi:arylsulfatase A-like enzyme